MYDIQIERKVLNVKGEPKPYYNLVLKSPSGDISFTIPEAKAYEIQTVLNIQIQDKT